MSKLPYRRGGLRGEVDSRQQLVRPLDRAARSPPHVNDSDVLGIVTHLAAAERRQQSDDMRMKRLRLMLRLH